MGALLGSALEGALGVLLGIIEGVFSTNLIKALFSVIGGAGKLLGSALEGALDGLLGIIEGVFKLFEKAGDKGIVQALFSVIGGMGALLGSALEGALGVLLGIIEGVFNTNLTKLWDSIWSGVIERLSDLLPDFLLDTLGLETRQGQTADEATPSAAAPTVFGAAAPLALGAGAASGAPQSLGTGEVRVVIEDRSGAARLDSVTSDSDNLVIEADTGFSLVDLYG